MSQFSRTELLIGKEAVEKLQKAKVAIFGIGGVGSYVVEALVRAGIKNFTLVDKDVVDITNLNRQIIATHKTIGQPKVEVAKERILEINPNAKIEIYKEFFLPESKGFLDETIDYIVDAVDTVTAKIEIILRAQADNIPVISWMGAGNKLDPAKFQVKHIYEPTMCPLAKVMRRELKKRGVKSVKVVYSTEKPSIPLNDMDISCRKNCICPPGAKHKCTERRDIPGSVSFVPSVVGLEDV